jgi:diadenosine tetraphosphatase ApaH/serine/threonine PP2A family protein phosphatase
MTSQYGFSDECAERFPNKHLWNDFLDVFNYLPLAAIVERALFCVHGGITEPLDDVNIIDKFTRPLKMPASGLVFDLLWSDPDPECPTFGLSARNVATYGAEATECFLYDNDLKYVIRAHETARYGYAMPFGDLGMVITVFSAPNYGGTGNLGAIMIVGEDLTLTFKQFH